MKITMFSASLSCVGLTFVFGSPLGTVFPFLSSLGYIYLSSSSLGQRAAMTTDIQFPGVLGERKSTRMEVLGAVGLPDLPL